MVADRAVRRIRFDSMARVNVTSRKVLLPRNERRMVRLPSPARRWNPCASFRGLPVLWLALLLTALLCPIPPASVEAQAPTEYQVKAAYLFNFLKFVEWPDDPPDDPHGKWTVGFIGDTRIADELGRLAAGKSVLGRELQIKKLQPADNPRACNVLFISESERKRLPALLASLRGSSVLTVADMDDFVGSGGMVQFVVEDARVRVAIDVSATTRARLKVSSKLLLLAHVVPGTERGANN